MPSIKDYNLKLARLKNTRKMTRTMKLVSMSKLIRAQESQRRAKTYAQRIADLISRLAVSQNITTHPLVTPHTDKASALVLLITADRGLCAGFNNTLIRGVNAWIETAGKEYENIDFSFCGRRGYLQMRSKYNERTYYANATAKPDFITASRIGDDLSGLFTKGEYRDVYVAYNRFLSPLSQKPIIEKILPIESKPLFLDTKPLSEDYIFEPQVPELVEFLIPRYLYFMIYFALLENSAGEHGARMTAMDSATKNTEEQIANNTMMRNRVRQADITAELIEIISGADALNQ